MPFVARAAYPLRRIVTSAVLILAAMMIVRSSPVATAATAGTADSQLIRRVVDTVTGQKPTGASVETTINPKAQQAAAKALGNRNQDREGAGADG